MVTASAGNHGRALAEAGADTGTPCVIFTPSHAPRAKLDAIRAAGAHLDATAATYDDAETLARQYARDGHATFVSAYNDPAVIAGAGTIGLEIVADCPGVDVVIVPVGGGGLLSGIGLALEAIAPSARLVGVEAALNPVFQTARALGRPAKIEIHASLADGLVGNVEDGSITCAQVERLAGTLAVASESDIAAAIGALAGESHLIVEGAGAVGVAALMAGAVPDLRGRSVVVVVSGANIDRERLTAVLTGRV